ncbi:rhomboid family intramembrane serine protease [Massilia sp. PAMC28688]|uniref:rhomboid family intramembrane serine protease n=1 Tax=Massilia sp. PAMC28688 TaxID=2861283 RepID=UPI001C626838|nr:rhomboid family intramembrane serine protease [Massilia sp. PAMC28688]QYF94573.1 rhomboid family intramembrane serine protease [Massilia sp. PAMC28688]
MTTSSTADSGAPAAPSRITPVVMLLAAISILVYLVQLGSGVHWMSPQVLQMIAWGANVAPLTLTDAPWRLLSSMFLHIGLIHIALNMYMLLVLGPFVERAFGKLRFLLIYLLSGLFGSLASAMWFSASQEVSVAAGASGALMGISGAFLGRILSPGRGQLDAHAIGMKGPLIQTIAINLVIGFLNTGIGIDNAAHIGGLVAGLVLGLAFSLLTFGRSAGGRLLAMVGISAAALGILWQLATRAPSPGLLVMKYQLQVQMARAAERAPPSP